MKKLIAILSLVAATASGQYLGETNVQTVTALVFIPYGTNHYTNGWWWTNSAYVADTNLGLSLNEGGSVANWAAWRAVNANFLFLKAFVTNSIRSTNAPLFLDLLPQASTTTNAAAVRVWNSNNAAVYARGTNGTDKLVAEWP
jgi:hypothetical protein